jgi:DNA-directed RNA polymerase specialized sigma24 family protein
MAGLSDQVVETMMTDGPDGDMSAYYQPFRGWLEKLVVRHVYSREEREDVVADCLLHYVQSVKPRIQKRPVPETRAWLHTIMLRMIRRRVGIIIRRRAAKTKAPCRDRSTSHDFSRVFVDEVLARNSGRAAELAAAFADGFTQADVAHLTGNLSQTIYSQGQRIVATP